MQAETNNILDYLNQAKEEYTREVSVLKAAQKHIGQFAKHAKLTKKIEGELVEKFSLYVPATDKRWDSGEHRNIKISGWTNRYTEIFYGYQIPVVGWYPVLTEKLGQAIVNRQNTIDEIENTIKALSTLARIEKDIAGLLEEKRASVPGNLYRTEITLNAFPLALNSRL